MTLQKNKKIVLAIFCVLMPIFLLLLSYNTVLFFTELSPAQKEVFLFLEDEEELSGFTGSEISHLEDVKGVMRYADSVFYSLLLILTGIITHFRKDREFLWELFDHGGKTTIVAMALLGFFSLLFFDAAFAAFHEVFFPQGNWQFPADSLLVRTFPLDFFVRAGRSTFLLALVLGIIFILSKHFYHYVRSHRH